MKASSVEPASVGNHHAGCLKSCRFRDNPKTEYGLGNVTGVIYVVCISESLDQVQWKTKHSQNRSRRSISRSFRRGVAASVLTFILKTRPGKQECLGKHDKQAATRVARRTPDKLKKSSMSAQLFTTTCIKIEDSLRGSIADRHRSHELPRP